MNVFTVLVLLIAGLGFLAFGLWFLIDPITPLAMIGIEVSGAAAASEFRAFYGGLLSALGLLVLASALRRESRIAGLWLVLACNAGIALGRLLGIIVDGVWVPFFGWALAWELGFALLAALALRTGRRRG